MTPADAAKIAVEYPQDLTNGCYVIADGGRGDATEPHVVIDLDPRRAGRCYEVFWDRYGLAGDMPVVARTVVELLMWLLATDPQTGRTSSAPFGDAYDAV